MVAAEDARGCTALHYACRTLDRSERSASVADLNLIKEGAEEVRAEGKTNLESNNLHSKRKYRMTC